MTGFPIALLLLVPALVGVHTPGQPYTAPHQQQALDIYRTIGLFIRESDVFAHGLNERVPVRSFYDGLDYWHTVMMTLGGGGRASQ